MPGRGGEVLWWLLPWLGLLTTLRLDAAVASAIVVVWLAWVLPARRWAVLAAGFGWIALLVVSQLAIQRVYYGDWLPNTYYLKLSGISLERRSPLGRIRTLVLSQRVWPMAACIGRAIVARVRSKDVALLVAVLTGQAAYSIYVGGDSWEWWGGANRYLSVAMPLAFVLLALAAAMCGDWFAMLRAAGSPAVAGGVTLAIGAISLLQVNAYEFYNFNSLSRWALVEDPPQLKEHFEMLDTALRLKDATTPDARIAVTWAGIIPYFSERPAVDLLGKDDRHVARGPDRPIDPPPMRMFELAPVAYCWPGHSKRDFDYSIIQLEPDVVQLWYDMAALEPTFNDKYELAEFGAHQFFVKKGSPNVKSFVKAED